MPELEWTICGRVVGTASGWDHVDTFVIQLYDFQPGPEFMGDLKGTFTAFDFEHGLIETYSDDGTVLQSVDLIDAINRCPRRKARQ
jgi:hypothetical protein